MLFRFIPAPFAFAFDGVQRRSDGAVTPPGTERALPSASDGQRCLPPGDLLGLISVRHALAAALDACHSDSAASSQRMPLVGRRRGALLVELLSPQSQLIAPDLRVPGSWARRCTGSFERPAPDVACESRCR